jgi:opacity protein-like surface antigen
MTKKLVSIVAILLLYGVNAAHAREYVGVGIHVGAHHDVGNISSDPSVKVDPQNNSLIGFSLKINMGALFLRSGVDTTFLINQGDILENTAEIDYYQIHYTAIPAFMGFAFPIQDIGEFYMGGGMAYFIGSGKIKSSVSGKEDIQTSAYGFGVIAGIQLNIVSSIKLYMEWEYLDGRSEPITKTQSTYDWDNFYVDFTGHRILLGIMYYLI